MFVEKLIGVIIFAMCFYISLGKEKNYGNLSIVITKCEVCKGPRRLSCGQEESKIITPSSFHYKLNLDDDILLTNGKMVGISKGKELLRYQMKKPCDNVLINALLRSYVNVTENCMVPKGLLSVNVTKFELCKGPKRRDCCVPKVGVSDAVKLSYDFIVKEDFTISGGRIVGITEGKQTVKFQMKNACDHFLVKNLFQTYLNVTENCTLSKGHYVFTANIVDLSKNYYGGKFFYGNWTFKSVFYGNDCNFFCTILHIIMKPRN